MTDSTTTKEQGAELEAEGRAAELHADLMPSWLTEALGEDTAREAWADCPPAEDGRTHGEAWAQDMDEVREAASGVWVVREAALEAQERVAELERQLAEARHEERVAFADKAEVEAELHEAHHGALVRAHHLARHAVTWADGRCGADGVGRLREAEELVAGDVRRELGRLQEAEELVRRLGR